MKPQDQIKALAELAGLGPQKGEQWNYSNPFSPTGISVDVDAKCKRWIEKNYLTSYDAIIPLIHKVINRYTCHGFFDALGLIAITDWQDVDGAPSYEGDGSYFEIWVLFKATPSQLSEALLRATGKWKENE